MIGQKSVAINYHKAIKMGSKKDYPSLELVRLDSIFFKGKKGDKILEIGIGSGCNTVYLAQKGYKVTGIDIAKSSKIITEKKLKKKRISNKNFQIKILKYNYKTLPFKRNYFDHVVCMSVLSLLGSKTKIEKLLRELNRVMKPSGKIILDINDANSEFSGKNKKLKKDTYLFEGGMQNFICYCPNKLSTFVNIVKKSFKVVDKGFAGFKLFKRRINEWIVCAQK